MYRLSHSRSSRAVWRGPPLGIVRTQVNPLSRSQSGSLPSHWQFLLYRLFSLSGLVPIGGFLVVHLMTNASTLSGPAAFQNNVNLIHGLGPALPLVEWLFIFGPLIFHAAIGLLIISGAVVNVGSYPYSGNVRYTLQRATAIIALFFIIWHVMHMHSYGKPLGLGLFDPQHAASSANAALAPMLQKILYAIGVIAVCYHFANGLWTLGITWGIWTSTAAMRRANYVVLVIGIVLTCFGLSSIVGVSTTDPEKAKLIEQRILDHNNLLTGEDLKSSPAKSDPPADSTQSKTANGS